MRQMTPNSVDGLYLVVCQKFETKTLEGAATVYECFILST